MRYFVFVSLFVFGFISCKTKQILSSPLMVPKVIEVKSLDVVNFSEKMLGLGSKADELVLFIFEDTDESKILRWSSEVMIFDNSKKSHAIPFQTKVKQGEIYSFILIEVDTERTVTELLSIIKQCDYPWNEDSLKKALKDDDLLGLKQLEIQPMAGETLLEFWGVHMLDEYRYILHIE